MKAIIFAGIALTLAACAAPPPPPAPPPAPPPMSYAPPPTIVAPEPGASIAAEHMTRHRTVHRRTVVRHGPRGTMVHRTIRVHGPHGTVVHKRTTVIRRGTPITTAPPAEAPR